MIKKSAVLMLVLVLLLSITAVAQAQVVNALYGWPYTMTAPDDATTCSPVGTISTTGLTADSRYVHVWFFAQDPVTLNMVRLQDWYQMGDLINVPFPYELAGTFTGSRLFEARIDIIVGTSELTKLQAYWTITCSGTPTPPPGGEGCTPGFWRNHYELWPAPYTTGSYFDTVFGVSYFSSTYTLGQAIWAGGGGLNVLARHGTAALLSAASPDVDYPYTVDEVIAMVQAGNVAPLSAANELGCPLR